MSPPVPGLAHAHWPPEVRHTRGAVITRRAGATRGPGVVTNLLFFLCIFSVFFSFDHLERVQCAPLEVDHGLAVEDEPLDGAVQPDDDPGLGTDAVQVPETGEQAITLDGILQ